MALIQGIHHVCLKTCSEEEYKKTVDFYKNVLELTAALEWENGTMLHTGSGIIEIINNAVAPLPQGAVRHFALATADVDACVKKVADAGYEVFIEPKDIVFSSTPAFPARIAFCHGPVGEELEFFQER